jgi:hypothetical protein
MKRLSVVLLLLGLAGCNYPSKLEARRACERWESQEKELSQIKYIKTETADWVHLPAVNEDNIITSRYCEDDSDIRQFVGHENYAIQNETWENKEGKKGKWKAVKNFLY